MKKHVIFVTVVFVLVCAVGFGLAWYNSSPRPIPTGEMYVPDPAVYQKAYDQAKARQKAEAAKEPGFLIQTAIHATLPGEENDGEKK